MKHVKIYESFLPLKQQIIEYFIDIQGDYDEEEFKNAYEILDDEYDDELNGLSEIDATILCRLIDGPLYNIIQNKVVRNSNPFDFD